LTALLTGWPNECGTHAAIDRKGSEVTYSLFYTDAPMPADKAARLRRVTPLRFDTLGEAITAAGHLIKNGSLAWRIESPSGFVMEQRDIEIERLRRRDATNKPREHCRSG
jgi:hypothetical protein